jgi:putative membrane protein (TIGR04086 family)
MGNINNYKILSKNLALSMMITLILLLVLSMVLSLSDISENITDISIIFISSFSILLGAFLSSKKIKEKGIVFGAILGFAYMILLYLISSVLNADFSFCLNTLYMFLGGIIGGSIGGILGVNLK